MNFAKSNTSGGRKKIGNRRRREKESTLCEEGETDTGDRKT